MKTDSEGLAEKGRIAATILGADLMGMLVAIVIVAAIALLVMHGGRTVEASSVLHQIPYPQ